VERSLSALAAQSAGVEAEASKTMAAGAGAGSAFSELSPSDLGPESTLPISYSDNGWSFGGLTGLYTYRVGAPQPPQPPKPPKPPTIGPIRGRYRLYLRCPAAPERPNEATAASANVPGRQRTHQSAEPQPVELHHQSACLPQQRELPGESFSQPHQPSPLPQHSHRHLRRPVAETTTPESNPTQSQPGLSPQHTQADPPQCPTDGQADTLRVDNQATLLPEPHRPIPSQQAEPLPQHSHRHCRWPVPVTSTSEPNPTQSQPNLYSEGTGAGQTQASLYEGSLPVRGTSPGTLPEDRNPSISLQQPEMLLEAVEKFQQPALLPQHSHRHCRWPAPVTTAPEPNKAQSQSEPCSQDAQAHQSQATTGGNAVTIFATSPGSFPGEGRASKLPQQPEPLPQHSHRHCWWPIPVTTAPEPDQTQSPSEPCSQNAPAHQSQATTGGNAVTICVTSPVSFPRAEGRASKPPQQPDPLPQHSHRHCRWPIPITTAPEPNPTPLRQTASSVNDDTLRPTASPSLISSNRTQTRTSSAGSCPGPPSQPANSRPGVVQPIQPNLTPPPGRTTHSPLVEST
jgi:hypothetical protein